MALKSLALRKSLGLEVYLPDNRYYLNGVKPRLNYKDNKPTDTIVGYVYTATNTSLFTQIEVFIEQEEPLISSEKLAEMQAAEEPVFVEFTDAVVKPYYSTASKCICDSIRAKGIDFVAETQ